MKLLIIVIFVIGMSLIALAVSQQLRGIEQSIQKNNAKVLQQLYDIEQLIQKNNVLEITDSNVASCVTGLFAVNTFNLPGFNGSIIGEQVICAKDWKISNIYGPSIEAFEDTIQFNETDKLPIIIQPSD